MNANTKSELEPRGRALSAYIAGTMERHFPPEVLEAATRAHLHGDTDIVRGHPDNPLGWDEIHAKFQGLVEPKLGKDKTAALFDAAREFGAPGSMAKLSALLEGDR
jgi:hypothetical protein